MDPRTGILGSETYRRGVRRVLLVTLALNVVVVAGKLIAGLLAGSLSVISDAIHSSIDSLNNIVGLVVMKYATADPDEDHPYGHAKFETLAAFAIAGFLFVTCYQISLSALKRIFAHDTPAPEITALTIGVMVGTIGANIIRSSEGWRGSSERLRRRSMSNHCRNLNSLFVILFPKRLETTILRKNYEDYGTTCCGR